MFVLLQRLCQVYVVCRLWNSLLTLTFECMKSNDVTGYVLMGEFNWTLKILTQD